MTLKHNRHTQWIFILKSSFVMMMTVTLASCGDSIKIPQRTLGSTEVMGMADNVGEMEDVTSKPLDFDLVMESNTNSGEGEDFSRQEILPNLFDREEKEKKVLINGKLLNDPEVSDYIDSIDGAEISVEIKIH